jgi:hypothetical protein
LIYPIALSRGKRLFDEGIIPAGFKLTKNYKTVKGVIVAVYDRN